MFDFSGAPMAVRGDIAPVMRSDFHTMARPGAVLPSDSRIAIAAAARMEKPAGDSLQEFAKVLYFDPASVHSDDVRRPANEHGDPAVVETIGIVARLAAIDRFHRVLDIPLEPLPTPRSGQPTGETTHGLKRRRGHVPMPTGAIPIALDLVPAEGEALRNMFGPMYMTDEEMADPLFRRDPGLDTPQLETVAARISHLNECFY